MKDPVVVGSYMSKGGERPTVNQCISLYAAQSAAGISMERHGNFRWMTSSIDPEDLLPVKVNSYRPPRLTS